MGKPTGFMEFDREPAHQRDPLERIKDWREDHPPYEEETLREQAARCMNCGVPFCHAGQMVAGMTAGCPVNNLIPEWNDLVYLGKWEEASIRLHETNDFPEFTGRVCPAPCEGSCTLGINAPPVTIKTIEREIVERAFAAGWVRPRPPLARTGKRVAVVGSGPAGLAAASQLNRAGHSVTVFERDDRIGGLLVYGIPNVKLDKAIVERRVNVMVDEGVKFAARTEVGRSFPASRLLTDFDAAVLAVGATAARDLPIEGRSLDGIHLAMEFLSSNTRSFLDSRHADGRFIGARGKNVVVIGGGDTGTDCVATAIRHGAASVVQLEIMPRPPDVRAADNPWPQWPRVYKLDYGQEEAEALWGADPRRYSTKTRRFLDDGRGQVSGIEVVDVEWSRGEDGGPRGPREVEGTSRTIPADLALLALGFVGPERRLLEELGVKLDERGNVATDADMMTTVAGLFAAGDCSRGQSLVVWAIHEGRKAAQAVDRYLTNGDASQR